MSAWYDSQVFNHDTMTNQEYLAKLGVSRHTWYELRRICRQLHKLDEMACNGEIQCDDSTDQWYRYQPDQYGTPTIKGNPLRTQPIDLVRFANIIAEKHGLKAFHQSDPRGCSLYLYNEEELAKCSRADKPGYGIWAYYSTIGTAIV